MAILASIKLAMVRVLLPENGAPTFGQLEKFAALQMDIFRRVAEARPPVRRRARRRQR